MGRVAGKVALVTGAARGVGRAIATRLAFEGAAVVLVDRPDSVPVSTAYPLSGDSDLAETAFLVERAGGRAIAHPADVRDAPAMVDAVAAAIEGFGRLDIVCANAGIITHGPSWELTASQWQDVLDVNLTGSWNTMRAAVPSMIRAKRGGAIVFTSSIAGLKGMKGIAHYAASKHGLVGLMRSAALELGEHMIRVNSVHPTGISTAMLHNDAAYERFRPDLSAPTRADIESAFVGVNVLPVPWVEPEDVANAAFWLVSDEARYVTGVALPVDAGASIK